MDRVTRGKHAATLKEISGDLHLAQDHAPIAFSARTGLGVKEIWKEIKAFLQMAGGAANRVR
jgi:hypothetical protein